MKLFRIVYGALAMLGIASFALAEGEQRIAAIGDLPLSCGATLRNCRVGYRTFGTINSDQSNVVLIPTWFLGKSGDWADMIVRGHLVDSKKYFVIVADSLGNGISSSPSNSDVQSGTAFPEISTHDMVESQYRLLTKALGIKHLLAAVGISMGGMQTFEWVADHPEFVQKAVPIVGTPRVSAADLTLWRGGLALADNAVAHPEQKAEWMGQLGYLFGVILTTTHRIDATVPREQAVKAAEGGAAGTAGLDPLNVRTQLRAIMSHDLYSAFGGEQALLSRVKARMLIVPSVQDRCVDPAPALAWAKLFHSKLFLLEGDGGHNAPGPEIQGLSAQVNRFLSDK